MDVVPSSVIRYIFMPRILRSFNGVVTTTKDFVSSETLAPSHQKERRKLTHRNYSAVSYDVILVS